MTVVRARSAPLAAPQALLTPRLDSWALGWFAVAVWLLLVGTQQMSVAVPMGSWLVWSSIVVGATHFAMSYRLAYHDRWASVRSHPFALAVGPVILAIVLGIGVFGAFAGSARAVGLLDPAVKLVYALTVWHYVKQVYGVVRLAAGARGFRLSPLEAKALRFGLYPLWMISAARFVSPQAIPELNGFTARTDLLHTSGSSDRLVVLVATVVWLTGVIVWSAWRQGRLPPSAMVAPIVAALMWVGWMPSMAVAALVFPAFHAVQYLACCYRAQHGLSEYSNPTSPSDKWQLAQTFIAAGCVGLLLTRVAPDALNTIAAPSNGTRIWLSVLFVFLNLHHYLIDATIWRSGGELVGLVTGPRPTGSS